MNSLSFEFLSAYWSAPEVATNIIVFMNLLGAMLLGLVVGYELAGGSLGVAYQDGRPEWRFVAVALGRAIAAPITVLAGELAKFDGVESFSLAHARN